MRIRYSTIGLSIFLCAGCEPGLSPSDTQQVRLSGGIFVMGSTESCTEATGVVCAGDRLPHPVNVSPFFLDVTEVSQLQFAAYAQANNVAFAFDSAHKDEPVLVDDPDVAAAYCKWKDPAGRLPTEAEFEYASRSDAGGMLHTYPWGDAAPDCTRLAFAGCAVTSMAAVGSNQGDKSAAGVFDLAGNAPEWTLDSYVPSVGCVDHLTYGELCWGKNAGCTAARCATDSDACGKGCLPPSIDVGSTGSGAQVTNAPVCPALGDKAPPQDDPLVRTPSGLAVIRGGSYADGPCALAGYTRRHAEPRRALAGFRCAKSVNSGNTPKPTVSYRFTITNCADAATAKVTVTSAGMPAMYSLDVFPSTAQAMMTMSADQNGSVDGVPCDAVFVVRPASAVTKIDVTASSASACAPAANIDFTGGGDVPAVGIDEMQVGGQCGG